MYLRFFMPDGYGRLLRELTARFCREVTGSLSVVFRSGTLLPFSGMISLGTCGIRGELIGMRREKGAFPQVPFGPGGRNVRPG